MQLPAKRKGKAAAAQVEAASGERQEQEAEGADQEEKPPKAGRLKAHDASQGLHLLMRV